MLSLNPENLSERENYKFLIGSIIPRPVAFVTTQSKNDVLNGAPFSYFNIVSSNPAMISLSLQRSLGERKDTARNIIDNKEFVVHIVDEENVEKVNKTAASLPPDESEITLAQLTPVKSERVKVAGVKEAKVRFECSLVQAIDLGGCDLFIGKVEQYHVDESIYSDGKIDPRGLGAVSRLAGSNYAKIGDIFSIERPK
ncbi:flavin reductase family protein [Sutcliffiella cohnii]